MKKIHRYSGLTISVFIAMHLFNHLVSFWSPEMHISTMETMRLFYRQPVIETLLLLAIAIQMTSGLSLMVKKRKTRKGFFSKLQRYSGLYLMLFLLIHLSAVFAGRLILKLDTNFYFGAAGLNTFPYLLFFIPYYGLAILAFFGHFAAIHYKKMKYNILGLSPLKQSVCLLVFGVLLAIVVLFGLTNGFTWYPIPAEYSI